MSDGRSKTKMYILILKPATDEMFSNRADAVLPTPAESGIGNVYEVEALLDHDFKYKVLY
jgi:hypothetical protein